jgi:hypothetical protein
MRPERVSLVAQRGQAPARATGPSSDPQDEGAQRSQPITSRRGEHRRDHRVADGARPARAPSRMGSRSSAGTELQNPPTCGTLRDGSYCPDHARGRSPRAWRKVRKRILERDRAAADSAAGQPKTSITSSLSSTAAVCGSRWIRVVASGERLAVALAGMRCRQHRCRSRYPPDATLLSVRGVGWFHATLDMRRSPAGSGAPRCAGQWPVSGLCGRGSS